MNLEQDIILAATFGRDDLVSSIIANRRINIHRTNEYGENALMTACWGGHEDCVYILLEAGVDSTRTNIFGQDAAKMARDHGHHEVADMIDRFNRGI